MKQNEKLHKADTAETKKNILPDKVTIAEVGPRDGLQNLSQTLPVETRIEFIERLAATGLQYVETGSFVSPQKVPQMADTGKVLQGIKKKSGCIYPVLTPNRRGIEDALDAGATHVAVFGAVSETFCKKNINCSIDESLHQFSQLIALAQKHKIAVRGYLSCVLGCPYEGDIPVQKTTVIAEKLFDMGCHELSLGDTIGIGTPDKVINLIRNVSNSIPLKNIAVHFHDTYGQALANIYAALQEGISIIDTAVAGLGGCPYAPGSSGNVATEDVIYMLHGLGIKTTVNLSKLIKTSHFICDKLKCRNNSKVSLAHTNNNFSPLFSRS